MFLGPAVNVVPLWKWEVLGLCLRTTCLPPRVLHIVCSSHSTSFLLRSEAWGIGKGNLPEGEFSQFMAGITSVDPSEYSSSGTQYQALSGIHYRCCWQQTQTSWINKGEGKRQGASKTNQQIIKRKGKKKLHCLGAPTQPTNYPNRLRLTPSRTEI